MAGYLICDAPDCTYSCVIEGGLLTEADVGRKCPECGEVIVSQADFADFKKTLELAKKMGMTTDPTTPKDTRVVFRLTDGELEMTSGTTAREQRDIILKGKRND